MAQQTIESGHSSGFIDYLGQKSEARQWMLSGISDIYRLYGYQRLETPVLERLQTLQGKAGSESEGLIYKVADPSGEFSYGMRFDLTVPLARFVAQNEGRLQMPFSRYQIGEVFRAERAQISKGRLRGFTQCDADRVGVSGSLSDAEVVMMMGDIMHNFHVPSTIRINDRRILDGLIEETGLQPEEGRTIMTSIDKVDKIGSPSVLDEIQYAFGPQVAKVAEAFLEISGTPAEVIQQLDKMFKSNGTAQEGIQNLEMVMRYIGSQSREDVTFKLDPSIARGLSYYTGIIYETNLNAMPQIGSVCSGGRYDNLVKTLGGPDLPAVGTSVGVDRLLGGLEETKTIPQIDPIQAYVTVMEPEISMQIATKLRQAGIPTVIGTEGSKLNKQLKSADRIGVKTAIMCGTDEIAQGIITIKDMETGKQTQMTLDELITSIHG